MIRISPFARNVILKQKADYELKINKKVTLTNFIDKFVEENTGEKKKKEPNNYEMIFKF